MHIKFLTAGLMLGFALSPSVFAQSSNLTNSATVVASCSMATTQNLNFGSINGLDFNSFSGQAQGMVKVKCTAGSYQVYVGNGENVISGSGNTCLQRMKSNNSGTTIVYALNTNETYSTVYPNGTTYCPKSSMNAQVYNTATFTSATREVNIPVYASIQKSFMVNNQFTVGTYSDNVTVYIAF